jgi:DNA-binding transcriptional ArsR family regulator
MAGVMEIVADPMRREILRRVWETELPVQALVEAFDVSQPAISFHLRVLRDGGLVTVRQQGTQRFYRAVPEALGELRAYLDAHWQDRLARLKDEAEIEARRQRRRAKQRRREL